MSAVCKIRVVFLALWACLSIPHLEVQAAPCDTPLPTKPKDKYDFIIVGAGSAGATLAARLSEDESVTVLLLEAGDDDRENFLISTPSLAWTTFGTFMDWEFPCERDERFTSFINETPYLYAGKVLGGSSSTNDLIYAKGSKNDYDLWASYTNDSSWSYENVLPYFIKSESSHEEQFRDSPFHGFDGGLHTMASPTSEMAAEILKAGEEAGWYLNPDYNGETVMGLAYAQTTKFKGRRSTTSRAFLWDVLDRPNLDVVVRAYVSKINLNGNKAVGVEVLINNTYYNVTANKEVILSAGALQSPKILMLSGIGPREVLEEFEIPVVVDLPGVGQNLMDHVFVEVNVGIDAKIGWAGAELFSQERLMEYLHYHTGPLSSNQGGEIVHFMATKQEDEAIDWPDIEIHIGVIPFATATSSAFHCNEEFKAGVAHRDNFPHGFVGNPVLVRPKSRGYVTIRDSDPFQKPKIVTNYYSEQEDVDKMVKGVRKVQELIGTQLMQQYGARMTESESYFPCEDLSFDTDEFWSCQAISRPQTINHPAGTAKMGPLDDPMTVLDSELRVLGIDNLRVIDGSMMPYIISGNINAPIIMVAEKMADVIRGRPPLQPIQRSGST